uniref:rhomboid domain-containing protein 3 isoform X3 n=1 Tax=Podarcis muralis TaxID=64176 RepID=UPI00109FC628|nr:rhomboid domain-containing protein 3 isoform X3 [Podarcis muralis]
MGMLMKRLWTRPWGLWRPPVASFTLMVLLCLFWLMGVDESLALSPNLLLSSPFQAYRLVTYCLCLTEAPLFFLNLLLFPLLSWHQERRQGTLRYLHSSALGAFASALLYLLLAWLQGAQAGSAVGGYTPVHLGLLGCPQGRRKQGGPWKWASPPLLAVLLLGLSWILSPSSPFLLHLSGLLTGLAFWAGVFSPLELSERRLEKLHGGIIFKTLQGRGSFFHFVRSPAEPAEILPTADPAARRDRIPHSPESPTQAFPPADFPTQPLFLASPPASYWSGETAALEQECRQSVAAGSLPPFPIHHGALGAPFSALQGSLMDEELLQAGIQASLQDMAEEEAPAAPENGLPNRAGSCCTGSHRPRGGCCLTADRRPCRRPSRGDGREPLCSSLATSSRHQPASRQRLASQPERCQRPGQKTSHGR